VEVVVHLVAGDHDALAARGLSALAGLHDLLDGLTKCEVPRVVLLSSAMVYGAWPNNPIPLTEDSPLRPEPGFVFAHQLAQVEELVDAWRAGQPERKVAVLRPVLFMSADSESSVVRALAAGMGHRFAEEDAPAQFLHLDDLAQAVEVAVAQDLDGVFNVAPDGWITGERVRALSGQGPRLKVPDRLSDLIATLSWRFQRGPLPPGLMPYVRHPWLVANDRMRQAGWQPQVTNEQAYVEGTEDRWWTMLTPKRKQELALGGMVTALVVSLIVAVSAIRRARRRRRG
jgi:nucleoside-diphosphate-sugar epimerase